MNDDDIIFTSLLTEATPDVCRDCSVYAFCDAGSCTFSIGQRNFLMDTSYALIKPHGSPISNLKMSDDFKARCVFVNNNYLNVFLPHTVLSVNSLLQLIYDPLVKLTPEQKKLEESVLDAVKLRYYGKDHFFRREVLVRALETLIYDMYDIVSHNRGKNYDTPTQGMHIFNRFVAILREGEYMNHRDVAWYAGKLFISPKYLTEVCQNCAGLPASYFVDFFVSEAIVEMLNDPTMTLAQIASKLHFLSQSHFSRYVKTKLGMAPKYFREQAFSLTRRR